MRVFVTGGTGLVGRPLCEQLCDRGDKVVLLSRDAHRARAKFGERAARMEFVEGDPGRAGSRQDAVGSCDAVINLAGEPVLGKRWTDAQKRLLRDSRIDGARYLAESIRRAATPPTVFVSTSAVGYYGNVPSAPVTESTTPGSDFLARLCVDWEAAAQGIEPERTRLAILRIGIVLAPDGGALAEMLPMFRWGVGAVIGRGDQWMSWIHRTDLVRMFLHALDTPGAVGPWNATAPEPVTNADFSRTLAKAVHRPCLLSAPAFALRLRFGEAAQVLLEGQRALPEAAGRAGFEFKYPTLSPALADLLPTPPARGKG